MAFEGYYLYSANLSRLFERNHYFDDTIPKYVIVMALLVLLWFVLYFLGRRSKKSHHNKAGQMLLIVCLVLVTVFPLAGQLIHMSQNGEFFDGYYIAYEAKTEDGTCAVVDIEAWPGVKTIEIPETLGEYKVTELEWKAFRFCADLETLKVPASVNYVSFVMSESMYNDHCKNLRNIYIEDLAAWCAIDFESNPLYELPGQVYLNGELLTDLVIPEDVTQIKQGVFVNRTCLTSLTVGKDVTEIGDYAFKNCTALTSVTMGENVTSIGASAFEGCTSLTSIELDNVTTIGFSAFEDCKSLRSVTIGKNVNSTGTRMFAGCTSLTSITYTGTMAQWEDMPKIEGWNSGVPATQVVCSDGVVALN